MKQATMAVNFSFNRSINTSPFILLKGKTPNIDSEIKEHEIFPNRDTRFRERDRHHDRYARKHIVKGKKTARNDFEIGQEVLIWRKLLGKKLANNWHSGFKIVDKIPPDAYVVSNGTSTLRANKAQIKAARRGRGNVAIINLA